MHLTVAISTSSDVCSVVYECTIVIIIID